MSDDTFSTEHSVRADVLVPLVDSATALTSEYPRPFQRGAHQTGEQVVQDAVNETGFGKFNIKLMLICCCLYMNASYTLTSIGFVLTAAACDFKMTTADKGRMSLAALLGMLCGSYLWGCVAEIKGRRIALMITLFLHGTCEFLASLMPSYWGFLVLKFISGLAVNGQVTLVYVYLGEFQATRYRDRFLSWLETPWLSGMLLVPLVAWIIIPLDIELKSSVYHFHSWNLFVLVCSLPPILIGVGLIFFPETPKYLAESGQSTKMLNVLQTIYAENTGKSGQDYIAKLKNSGNSTLSDMVTRIMHREGNDLEPPRKKSLRKMLRNIATQTVAVVKPPFLKRTVLMCTISFLMMCSFYTLILWLPELFRRYAEFEANNPNGTASVCEVTPVRKANETMTDPYGCDTPIPKSVYLNSVILGVASLPAGFTFPLFVDRLGYKFFLVVTSGISGLATIGLFFVQTSLQNMILSCVFQALCSICICTIFCMLVDLYPTNVRAMAGGLAAFCSRLGSAAGNAMSAYMIDNYCTVLIIIVALELLTSSVLGMLIPIKPKAKRTESKKPKDDNPT